MLLMIRLCTSKEVYLSQFQLLHTKTHLPLLPGNRKRAAKCHKYLPLPRSAFFSFGAWGKLHSDENGDFFPTEIVLGAYIGEWPQLILSADRRSGRCVLSQVLGDVANRYLFNLEQTASWIKQPGQGILTLHAIPRGL